MKPALKRHKRIPLLRIENSATTKRPTGPNAPCLSLVTHIEGKEGEAGTGRRKSFHKIQKKFFSSRDDTFLPTCPSRSAPLNLDVKQSLEIWLKMVDDNHCTKSKGKYPANALLVKSFKLQRI